MGRRILGRDRQLDRVQASLAELEASMAGMAERLDRHIEDTTHRFHRLFQVLERMADDEVGNRRRLVATRRDPSYEAAYEEADPLVSVLIPTYSNAEGLRERSLPSVLAQSHGHLEVVVVGDAAVPEVEDAVRSFDDPRVHWRNREVRGPYPEERELLWLVSGVPPWNDALFGVPSDWSLVRRMLRIGVRIGYLDQVVCDYYPSYRAAAEAG